MFITNRPLSADPQTVKMNPFCIELEDESYSY